MKFLILCVLAATIVLQGHGASVDDRLSESKLRRTIFQDYDKLVRPVYDAQNSIVVKLAMTPLAVKHLSSQVLTLNSWVIMKWKDEYLTWEPSDFNNITVLRLPASEVWKPDISLYTSAEDSLLFPTAKTNVLVYNGGDVLWVPSYTIKNTCVMKKDQEVVQCTIKFGSWTYDKPHLDIQLYKDEVELDDFQDSNWTWKLKDIQVYREEKFYPCCKEAYPSISYNITLVARDRHVSNEVLRDFKPIKVLSY